MAQVGQNADTLTRVFDNEGDSFGAIVRRGDCVDDNILKRDRAASSKEPNFVHLCGFEIPLRCGQRSTFKVNRKIELSLKHAHPFGVIAVIVRDHQGIDFGDIAACLASRS